MKTKSTKIAALFLVGMICLSSFSAEAYRDLGRSKKKSYRTRKMDSKSLAAVKVKNVEFAFNDVSVPESDYANLDKVVKLMLDNNAAVKVSGHADNKGSYLYNWKISEKRAKMVKAYLISKGADSTRIAATEYGFTKPIASNKTPEGRKKNRRVEVRFAE